MKLSGLSLCARYAYPPNSLSLCGPAKQNDLKWYSHNAVSDKGTTEIISQFETLYPYLSLIAYENNIKEPLSRAVVEAYWIGNNLLYGISKRQFANHLKDTLQLKKRLKIETLSTLLAKTANGGLAHHSFHVLNIFSRTGNMKIDHTIESMDACIVNWGKVLNIDNGYLLIRTKPLSLKNYKITFGNYVVRKIHAQGEKDVLLDKVNVGDWISYHWGYFCQKIDNLQLANLIWYTNLSLSLVNN